jgi:hypothetical protein
MKVEWGSDLYRTFRKNLFEWADNHSDINADNIDQNLQDRFNQILKECDAYVESKRITFSHGQVFDGLGMNENYTIKFRDPRKYLLFVLRWS